MQSTTWFSKSVARSRMMMLVIVPALLPLGSMLLQAWLPSWLTMWFYFTKGIGAWTLAEYALHRWLLHGGLEKTVLPFANCRERQPCMVWLIALMFVLAIIVFIPARHNEWRVYFTGMFLGISATICITLLGQMGMATRWFSRLLRHRQQHVQFEGRAAFGISTTAWDRVFGTLSPVVVDSATQPQELKRELIRLPAEQA